MPIPHEISELIERFDRNVDEYRSGQYNETQLRRDFIDPFFEALGWDVNNKKGYAEAYRHVVHEDAVKVGGNTKAPDYGFYVGETRKFFVEAKKPSVNIKHDVAPTFQLRRYGWSAKLPLSILTSFDEFAVYDCRSLKPVNTDKAATARVLYLGYKEYAERWDEIESVFSRDAVLKGSFDKYAEQTRSRRGTAEVDDAFLEEIESWRKTLASNIYLRNPSLTTRELNFAVGVIIDRIIFLRICEDRGIEAQEQLKKLITGKDVYAELLRIFYLADQKYNSGLFHFDQERGRAESPDTLTPSLTIDDKVFRDIFKNIYLPLSPYEFSVLPADILGQVYEQFLGKVIHLTAHRAVIDDKPEVRKAGGVYYTPSYIVDYIVKNTVGKLCEGKTPKEVDKLRILDPACGSGSFLINAYQYLLDWYRNWYVEDGAEKHLKKLTQDARGEWRLTTAEKRRILLQNIYGVDIDAQAVEVTKLSLLLKVLEGESERSLARQISLLHERALPDLGSNIKCGNSLIGPAFYDDAEASTLSDEEHYRINVFDWEKEFSEIMKAGGFDAVIGNPPYGASFSKPELAYLLKKFPQAQKFPDSYCLFMVEAIRLTRLAGIISFIVPNTFCDLESCETFRHWLLQEHEVKDIWQTGWAFKAAIVDTLVFSILKQKPIDNAQVSISVDKRNYHRPIAAFLSNELCKIDYRNAEEDKELLHKVIQQNKNLGDIATVKAGVKMYERGKGIPPQTDATLKERPFSTKEKWPKDWKVLYRGEDVSRYDLAEPKEFIDYGLWLAAPRSPELFKSPKILMRRTDDRLMACLDESSAICVNSCHVIKLNEAALEKLSYYYLLGILNSRLLQRIFELQNPQMIGKVFAEIKVIYVERLPIYITDSLSPDDKARHDRMVEMVEQMLALHKQLATARTDQARTMIQRRIESTDARIDALVYELYGLTDEEIKIVEGATL